MRTVPPVQTASQRLVVSTSAQWLEDRNSDASANVSGTQDENAPAARSAKFAALRVLAMRRTVPLFTRPNMVSPAVSPAGKFIAPRYVSRPVATALFTSESNVMIGIWSEAAE